MIYLICALPCEARPLIEYYGMQAAPETGPFRCYASQNNDLILTLSGIGRINAAAATAWTQGRFNALQSDAWLNVGMAGHRHLYIGSAALCHKIEDSGNGQSWFPQIVFEHNCPTAPLLTLDKPSIDYADSLFDMEASGFYATACKTSSMELVQALKIVSDNHASPVLWPDRQRVENLVNGQLPLINDIIEKMLALSCELASLAAPPACYDFCLQHWHFSRYEQHQLWRLLNRWQVLFPETSPIDDRKNFKRGKDLIRFLDTQLNRLPFTYLQS